MKARRRALLTPAIVAVLSSLCILAQLSSSFTLPTTCSSTSARFLSMDKISMRMSSNDGFGEDDLAKLRKKRQEILANRKGPNDITEALLSTSSLPTESTKSSSSSDMPPIPNVPLKRPSILEDRVAARKAEVEKEDAAASSSQKDKAGEKAASKSGTSGAAKGIDYLADYEDENELHIPNRIGFGTMSWGDESKGFVTKVNKKLKKKEIAEGKFVPGDLQVAYNTLIEGGIQLVDTSESYGASNHPQSLSSECMLGRFSEEYTLSTDTPLLASTFANPYSLFLATGGKSGVRLGPKSITRALERSCQRMETSNIELYQVQNIGLLGGYLGGKGALATGLAMALDRGYCNHVGVCNVGPRALKGFQKMMEKRGASISTNQFEFSLTNRKALRNGTIQACKDLGIVPLAHTPLDHGLASGKYTANNPSGGRRLQPKYDFKKVLEPLISVHDAQIRVAQKVKERLKKEFREDQEKRSRNYRMPQNNANANREVTPMQVAINYVVAKGAVPIPSIKNNKEAEELLGCIGWGLTDDEVEILDQAADLCGR